MVYSLAKYRMAFPRGVYLCTVRDTCMSVSFGASFQVKAGADPPVPPTIAYPAQATLLDDVEWALRNGVDDQGQPPKMWSVSQLSEFIESKGGFRGQKATRNTWSVQLGRRLAADSLKPGGFRQHKDGRTSWLYWQHTPDELPQNFSRAPRRVRFDEDAEEPTRARAETAAREREETREREREEETYARERRQLEFQDWSARSIRGKPGGQPAWSPEHQRRYGMFLVSSNPDPTLPEGGHWDADGLMVL